MGTAYGGCYPSLKRLASGKGATQLSCNTGPDVLYSPLLKLANGTWPLSRIALLP